MRCRGIRLRDRFVVRPPDAELAGGTGAWSLRGRCGRICRRGRQALRARVSQPPGGQAAARVLEAGCQRPAAARLPERFLLV